MKPGRVPCCVPFCGRTFADDGSYEVMCGKHWRLADPALRHRRAMTVRFYRAAERRGDEAEARRQAWLAHALWLAIKKEAIEIAAGIAG